MTANHYVTDLWGLRDVGGSPGVRTGFSKDTGRTEGEVGEENTGQGQDPRRAAVWGGSSTERTAPTVRQLSGDVRETTSARRRPGGVQRQG